MNSTNPSRQAINDELNLRIADISKRPGCYMNKVSRAQYKKENKEIVAEFLALKMDHLRAKYSGASLVAFLERAKFSY